jgi:hypothetical protein
MRMKLSNIDLLSKILVKFRIIVNGFVRNFKETVRNSKKTCENENLCAKTYKTRAHFYIFVRNYDFLCESHMK